MKFLTLCFCSALVCLTASSAVGRPPVDRVLRVQPPTAQVMDTHSYVDANKLLGFVTNFGNLFYDAGQFLGKNDGLYYPYTGMDKIINHQNNKTVIFDAGLWMGGMVNGFLRMAIAEYSAEYVPGPMINGTFDSNAFNPANRVYKIYSDSLLDNPNTDYLEWPDSLGAPVDQSGHPLALGRQTLFAVYNDADTAHHSNDVGATLALGVEVHQTVWASPSVAAPNNIINARYDLYNKGSNQINGMYLTIWSDPDIGDYTNDLAGCDTVAGVFFAYNTSTDAVYGAQPPAVGLKIVQGPIVPSPGDTATFFGTRKPNYRNLKPSAFAKFINGTDPRSSDEAYYFMQGLLSNGTPYKYNGVPTKFFCSGDPVGGTGDLDVNPSDRRMMVSIGPFNFMPGDSQQLIVKWGVGQGSSGLNSVSILKNEILGQTSCCVGMRGNIDMIGIIDLSDLSWLINYITTLPTPVLPCADAANIDGTGLIDLTDLSWLILYLTTQPAPVLQNCP